MESSWSDRSPYDFVSPPPIGPRPPPLPDLHQMLEGITEAGRQIRLAAAQHVDARSTRPTQVDGTTRQSAVFSRMVPLHDGGLGGVVNTWWTQTTKRGTRTTCGGRFQCRDLGGDAVGGWWMTGRVKRLTSLHWVPVVVEIWPRYSQFAMLTMTPKTPVLTSKRYFRLGHRVLDDLWSELSAANSGSDPTPPDEGPDPQHGRSIAGCV